MTPPGEPKSAVATSADPRVEALVRVGRYFAERRGIVLTILSVVLFVAIFLRGFFLHLDLGNSNRLRFHAIPVAIAVLEHGLPHDYTSRLSIAHRFQNGDRPISELIAEARAVKVGPDDGIYFWAADDRGMADFVIGAFATFGFSPTSMYRFYFVLLGISCIAFWAGMHSRAGPAAMLPLALTAIWVMLPVLALATESGFEAGSAGAWAQGTFIAEPRTLEILALLPVLHMGLYCSATAPRSRLGVVCLLVQILLFLFLYHARSSLGWMLVALAAYALLAFLRRDAGASRPGLAARLRRPVVVVGILLVAGLAGLSAYKHATYHPRYFQDLGHRTFWHNALMGLSSHSRLAQEYGLGVDDKVVAESVLRFARTQYPDSIPSDWTADRALLSLGSHATFDWKLYEKMARRMYVRLWRNHTSDVLRTYAFLKPAESMRIVVKATVPTISDSAIAINRTVFNLYYEPFAGLALFTALAVIALSYRHFCRPNPETGLVAVLLVASLIPSVAFYSAIMVLTGTFLCLSLCAYLLLPRLVQWIWNRSLTRAP